MLSKLSLSVTHPHTLKLSGPPKHQQLSYETLPLSGSKAEIPSESALICCIEAKIALPHC